MENFLKVEKLDKNCFEEKIYSKIISQSNLLKIVKKKKFEQKKIVMTNGCFDILHYGHCRLLVKAKNFGDIFILALNSDKSIKRLKGKSRPINSFKDRAYLLASLEYIDFIIKFEEDTPINLYKLILPDILVKGGDYKIDEIIGSSEIIENGGKVKLVNFEEGYSTTNTLIKLNQ